jgi:hypothetical protein
MLASLMPDQRPPDHPIRHVKPIVDVEEPAFDQSSFAKNRERLLDHQVSRAFFSAVLEQPRQRRLCRGGR